MKIYLSSVFLCYLLCSAGAKPGDSYVLTGREKSVFGIYQADMKSFPELYEGVDVNAYYTEFKALNGLDGRKLRLGEELKFPHTPKSRQIEQEKRAEAARAARAAEAATERVRAKEAAAAANPGKTEKEISLFGSDTRSRPGRISPEAERKNARQKAVYYFQRTFLPQWLRNHSNEILENGPVDGLITSARTWVDKDFAASLVLYRYPDKRIYILEFEKPKNVSEFFFVAIKADESGGSYFYYLEKGISFFGAGEESVLHEWRSGGDVSNLGGRDYTDLASFLQELEGGRPVSSNAE
ncbi:hypothetical protein P4B35_19645 [Pontiellaceae bacterium B12227]|nr:hypothetical protein [Pontiellaceae bacterium B12227]